MLVRAAILFATFVIASGVLARAERTERVPSRQPFVNFPLTIDDWAGESDPPLSEEVLRVLGADDYLLNTYYSSAGEAAALYIGYWETQKRGDTVHSPLNCIPGAGWEPVSNRRLLMTVPAADGESDVTVNRYVIQKGLDRQMVLYWYQSQGRVVASEYWGKAYLVLDSMRLNRSDTAIVRIMTPIRGDTPDAEAAAERTAVRFVQQLFPHLNAFLPE